MGDTLEDDNVSRDEWDDLRELYQERAAHFDQRFDALEQDLLERVERLEKRFEASGYFGKAGRPASASHPLAERVDDLESRLSLDVVTTALSKRMRRCIVITAVLVALFGCGLTWINARQIEQNTTITEGISTAISQDRDDNATMEKQIATLLQRQEHNVQGINQILSGR